jgi:hypothetical protein
MKENMRLASEAYFELKEKRREAERQERLHIHKLMMERLAEVFEVQVGVKSNSMIILTY